MVFFLETIWIPVLCYSMWVHYYGWWHWWSYCFPSLSLPLPSQSELQLDHQSSGAMYVANDTGNVHIHVICFHSYSDAHTSILFCLFFLTNEVNHVTLSFTDFELEMVNANCSHDYVEVLDGDNYQAPSVGKKILSFSLFCPQRTPALISSHPRHNIQLWPFRSS